MYCTCKEIEVTKPRRSKRYVSSCCSIVHLLLCTQLAQPDELRHKSLSNTACLLVLCLLAPFWGVLAYGGEDIDYFAPKIMLYCIHVPLNSTLATQALRISTLYLTLNNIYSYKPRSLRGSTWTGCKVVSRNPALPIENTASNECLEADQAIMRGFSIARTSLLPNNCQYHQHPYRVGEPLGSNALLSWLWDFPSDWIGWWPKP
jgi:hypothetical protein